MLSYQKTFDLIKQKGIKLYKIIPDGKIHKRMREGGHITTVTLERLCEALDCQPGDLVEYVPEQQPEE